MTQKDLIPPDNAPYPLPEPHLMHRSLHERPLEVTSASGSYLTLTSSRRILDFCAGAAVAVIGHAHPAVQSAILAQTSLVSYVHTGAFTTASAEALADCLLKDKPFGLTRAYFICSGSEATDSALKLARQYHVENGEPQRVRLVARRRAYHGNTLGAMSVGSFITRRAPYEDALLLDERRVSFVSPAYAYRGQREGETEEEYGARLVEELDAEFQRVGPETVMAFIAETIGGATAGCIMPPKGYLAGVRRVCDKYGILLILDEVMCGSGRMGTYFAFEPHNVCPDLVTLGKGVGGGYAPIAGVLANEKIVNVLKRGTGGFNHGHTYQAHPVSCAAALAVQKVIEQDGLVERCAKMGVVLEKALRDVFGNVEHVGDIRGGGLFWGIEFVKNKKTKEPFPADLKFGIRVQETALEMGLAVYPGSGTADGYVGDHIILAPPLNISREDMDIALKLLKEAYDKVVSSILI